MILHPHRPTRHIHRNANTSVGCGSPLDDEFFERVAEAIADAKAILITGPDSANSELAAHVTRHHPETARCVVGVETIDHPSDGALVAVARLYFKTKDTFAAGSLANGSWILVQRKEISCLSEQSSSSFSS